MPAGNVQDRVISKYRWPLSDQQREDLCRELLPWAEGLLLRRYGRDARQYAGLGLAQALDSYDPDRGVPFGAWAANVLVWTARDEIRTERGREGSRRREGNDQALSVQEWDADAMPERHAAELPPHHAIDAADELARVLKAMESMDRKLWIVGLGKIIGEFETDDLARMLGVGRSTINQHLAAIRRSLRSD